jgi:hypothetical protein
LYRYTSVVQEWLEAVVRKSVSAPPALVRAAAAARAAGTFEDRPVRFAGGDGDDDGGEYDDEDGSGGDSEVGLYKCVVLLQVESSS